MSDTTQELLGPNILIFGPGGNGKTFSLGTLVEWAQVNGKEVFCLFTENSLETLLGYWTDIGSPPFNRATAAEVPSCLHWHQQATKPVSLKALTTAAQNVGMMSYEAVTKMQDMNRGGENNAFWKILSTCADFPDDRTGKKFGPVDSWKTDKIFVIDSLTELSNAAMKMVIGSKPTAAPPDYGVSQNNLLNFIRLCTQGAECTFVMTAHPDRLVDEVTGTTKTMVKSIGKALWADIPVLFSEVIYVVREGSAFYWDTAAYGVDTKTRSLGYKAKISPDFGLIMNTWKGRGGK